MGLISRHSLAGEIRELIGRSNATSSGVTYTRGALDQAAVMNSAVITIPTPLGAIYSLSFWVKLKSGFTGSYRKFLECPGPSTDRSPGFWFHSSNNRIHMRQAVDGANSGADTVDQLTVGQWHHVAFSCEVLSNDTTRLMSWLDGTPQGESVSPGFPNYNTSPITLLSNDYDIEDIRVYDHVLSKREVVELSRGLLSRYRLSDNGHDVEQRGTMQIGSGTFIESDQGRVVSLPAAGAVLPVSDAPLDLKGETITFWQRCGFPRASAGSGSFSNWIVQWGTYYSNNSGGFGLQSGQLSYYLRGPGAGGWTNTGSVAAAAPLYDQGGWIHYAIVFTNDDRFKIFMNGTQYVNIPLSVPYTGLDSLGVTFGKDMQAELRDVQFHRRELSADVVESLYRQTASVDDRGSIHSSTFIQKLKARYIRDWLDGSTSNSGKHWLEVRAVLDGVNISQGKPVTSNGTGARLGKVTDGTTDNGAYAYVTGASPAWVQVDLGAIEEIDEVQVWHYNADGRTYYGTKTEVSIDGVNWFSLFDSEYDGLYQETPAGVSHVSQPRAVKPTVHGLFAPDVSEVGPADGLLAWYPLTDTTKQRALHGDIYNFTASLDINGVTFNGTNTFFRIPQLVASGATNRFTVVCLLKPQVAGIIMCPNSQGVDQFLRYDETNERVVLQITESADTNGRGYSSPVGSVPLNQWSFVAFSIDATDVALYVGGLYADGVVGTGPIGSWHGHWDIGRRANGTVYYGGRLKELRFYDRRLSPEEVASLHALLMDNVAMGSMSPTKLYAKRQIKEVMA